MIFHRSMQEEADEIEAESVFKVKKWTAVGCTVIVVAARVLWGWAH